MNRDQKAALVEELAEQIRSADTIFAIDYRGISVGDAADLRARLRDADTRFRIVKNSLTERASDQAGADTLKSMLEGPTALAFVAGDAALAAKALNDAARALGTLEFKGGLMEGAPLSSDDIKSLARLPARDVLHGQLVGTIAAPLNGLVRTLNALISGLAVQLQQVADQGLVSGEAPSAPEAPSDDASTSEAPADSEADGEATAPSPSASDADASPAAGPEAESEAAEPASEAEPGAAEPEAAEPETETEDASASESVGSEAEAEPSGSKAAPDSEADASAEQTETETDASDGEAEASKEDK